jgi:hypothetical protein
MSAINQNQLTLNLIPDFSIQKKQAVSNSNSFVFHKSDSNILKDMYNIKVTISGRSYIIKWKYKIIDLKSYIENESYEKTVAYVSIERISKYQWFMYIRSFVSKHEKQKFEKIIKNILTNFYFNSNISN